MDSGMASERLSVTIPINAIDAQFLKDKQMPANQPGTVITTKVG